MYIVFVERADAWPAGRAAADLEVIPEWTGTVAVDRTISNLASLMTGLLGFYLEPPRPVGLVRPPESGS